MFYIYDADATVLGVWSVLVQPWVKWRSALRTPSSAPQSTVAKCLTPWAALDSPSEETG